MAKRNAHNHLTAPQETSCDARSNNRMQRNDNLCFLSGLLEKAHQGQIHKETTCHLKDTALLRNT